MARPHIEFVHAQHLPWSKRALPGPLGELDCRMLSRDPGHGDCTAILRYPPGWRRPGPEQLSAAHELYVLDGELDISGRRYGIDCYAYLPAGTTHANWGSERGAVVLAMFDAAPHIAAGAGTAVADPDGPAVPYLNLHEVPWSTAGIDPDVQFLRLAKKSLRYNARTGDATFVLECGGHTHPNNWRERQLAHPCVEEMFLLSGDIVGERGVMTAGAYFWRPPHIWHGPFGSRGGNHCLIRFLGGHHVNIWSDQALPFSFDPPHNPALPDELKPFDRPRTLSQAF
ncbi:MAG: cupin domain-containing protein [Rhodospirillaceae bacterium]|nr:cupin domain-containing protein [Rhodospirillaceae bacterium]